MSNTKKDEDIGRWLEDHTNIRRDQDQKVIDKIREEGACWVIMQILKDDGISTEWCLLEAMTKEGLISMEEGNEIAERLSKMSKVVQVTVISIKSHRTIDGPLWGHPIAEERSENVDHVPD